MALWPQLDALPRRVQDRLRVEPGLRLGDICGGPFAEEAHRPSRRQRPDPVTPLPVPQATTQAARAQHQARRPSALGLFRAGGEVGGLPAVGELQADMSRFLRRHVPVRGWLGVVEPGANPKLEPRLEGPYADDRHGDRFCPRQYQRAGRDGARKLGHRRIPRVTSRPVRVLEWHIVEEPHPPRLAAHRTGIKSTPESNGPASRPAELTPGLAGLNVVRPRADALRAPCQGSTRAGGGHRAADRAAPRPAGMGGYFKILTARAITSPRIMRDPTACTVMASLAQRAIGITSVGLNA